MSTQAHSATPELRRPIGLVNYAKAAGKAICAAFEKQEGAPVEVVVEAKRTPQLESLYQHRKHVNSLMHTVMNQVRENPESHVKPGKAYDSLPSYDDQSNSVLQLHRDRHDEVYLTAKPAVEGRYKKQKFGDIQFVLKTNGDDINLGWSCQPTAAEIAYTPQELQAMQVEAERLVTVVADNQLIS